MDEDDYVAWKLHEDGASWETIALDLGCTPATAQALAGGYVERTNAAAHEAQGQLF